MSVKDLVAGKEASGSVVSSEEWRSARPDQREVARAAVVRAVVDLVGRNAS